MGLNDEALFGLVVAHRVAVDILGDLLGDVTNGRAFRVVDQLEAHAVFVRTLLVRCIAPLARRLRSYSLPVS